MTGYEIVLACLALNIYHEARGEPIEGQRAVAYVTINRAQASGKEVCDVVFEDEQFSWTIGNKEPVFRDGVKVGYKVVPAYRPNVKSEQWLKIKALAIDVLTHWKRPHPYKDLYYFHSTSVQPVWSRAKPFKMQIGNHIFYAEQKGIRYDKENTGVATLSATIGQNPQVLHISFRRPEQ